MRDPYTYLAELSSDVYGDSDADYDECPHCDSSPCRCDEIYETAVGK
ncbi:hypothetical protein ACMG4H_14265 [Corynebacterium glutamicum]